MTNHQSFRIAKLNFLLPKPIMVKWLSSFETMLPELHYWRHLKMLKVQFINIYTLILAHYQWQKLHILHSGKFYQRWVKYQSYIHIPSSKQHKKGSAQKSHLIRHIWFLTDLIGHKKSSNLKNYNSYQANFKCIFTQ